MVDGIIGGLSGLIAGVLNFHWSGMVMIVIGAILIYLGVKKDFEPLLLSLLVLDVFW